MTPCCVGTERKPSFCYCVAWFCPPPHPGPQEVESGAHPSTPLDGCFAAFFFSVVEEDRFCRLHSSPRPLPLSPSSQKQETWKNPNEGSLPLLKRPTSPGPLFWLSLLPNIMFFYQQNHFDLFIQQVLLLQLLAYQKYSKWWRKMDGKYIRL